VAAVWRLRQPERPLCIPKAQAIQVTQKLDRITSPVALAAPEAPQALPLFGEDGEAVPASAPRARPA